MRDAFDTHDVDEMRQVVRRRLVRAMVPAIGKLAQAARGDPIFSSDLELRACVALARLAPQLLGPAPEIRPQWSDLPEFNTPERLEARADLLDLREEWNAFIAQREAIERAKQHLKEDEND